jgi:hypothetical protein
MKQAQSVPRHNYIKKLQRMWESGALPHEAGYHQLTIEHDNWCAIFEDRHCDCNPEIRLKFSLGGHADT